MYSLDIKNMQPGRICLGVIQVEMGKIFFIW